MKTFTNLIQVSALLGASLVATSGFAAELDISITNLTGGSYFTPLLVVAHPEDTALFSAGSQASSGIQAMAEGGSLDGLQATATTINANSVANPAQGLLAPGANTTTSLTTDDNNVLLSVVSMILPSNDGFIGLNSLRIPVAKGTYTYNVLVYDAGTEANDELRGSGQPGVAGMPVPPPLQATIGNNGSGVTSTAEGFVHIHRGILGDLDTAGGTSDIDSSRHRWMNPAARVTVTVK